MREPVTGHTVINVEVIASDAGGQKIRLLPAERTRAGMAVAAANGRKAGRWEVTAESNAVKRAHELRALGLKPADIGKMIGSSRATVYRYLRMGSGELA